MGTEHEIGTVAERANEAEAQLELDRLVDKMKFNAEQRSGK